MHSLLPMPKRLTESRSNRGQLVDKKDMMPSDFVQLSWNL
jgi:hypothetical protein